MFSPGSGGVCFSVRSTATSSIVLEASSVFFTGVETAPGLVILSSSLLRRLYQKKKKISLCIENCFYDLGHLISKVQVYQLLFKQGFAFKTVILLVILAILSLTSC